MINQPFDKQLIAWAKFRQSLETSADPINDTIKFWSQVPLSSRNLDPYNTETWPTPWEMIEENTYCEFGILLAIAYTLKLTDRFSNWQPLFKIGIDRQESRMYYMLFINDQVIGVDPEKSVHINLIPDSIQIEKVLVLTSQY